MPPPFYVYVEGPRDRELLAIWARSESRALTRAIEDRSVILGGRQPARAAAHLEEARAGEPGVRGLCVLDRDEPDAPTPEGPDDLEFFTWGRRHIESYLLVPRALRAALAPRDDPSRLERLIRHEVPDAMDEEAFLRLDAKRMLGSKGPFARELGRAPDAGRVAQRLRPEELHEDVRRLLGRLRSGFGLCAPEVTHRHRSA